LSDFADYRISSESSAAFTITSRLAFKTSFGINYDTRPPVGLPKTFLNFINALSIKL
jgi:putative salt-induced outer membrane protein YdiY